MDKTALTLNIIQILILLAGLIVAIWTILSNKQISKKRETAEFLQSLSNDSSYQNGLIELEKLFSDKTYIDLNTHISKVLVKLL